MTAHGAWLAALSRRLLHRDTFETMVSPALADLQAEASKGWRTNLGHYAGLSVVLFAALRRDWRVDLLAVFDFGARRDVWLVTGIWYLAPTTLLAGLILREQTPWHFLDVSTWPAVVLEAVLAARLYASYVAAVAAAFFLSRRVTSVKALVIGVGAVTFAFVALNVAATLTRVPLNRTIYETASRNLAAATVSAGGPSSWDTQRWSGWVEARGRQATPGATAEDLVRAVAMAPFAAVFNFLPFALVGVALARAKGWAVVVRFVGLIVTAVVVFQISERALGPARTRSGSYAEGNNVLEHFGQMGSLVVAALLWTVIVPRVSRPIVALLQTNRGRFQAPD